MTVFADATIRASWIAEKESIRQFLIEQKKFNPKSVDKFIHNFVESMVFAKLPCQSRAGVRSAFQQFANERA